MARTFVIRHGSSVAHAPTAADAAELMQRLSTPSTTHPIGDDVVRSKLAAVNARLLLLLKEEGLTYSGLGQADKCLRRNVGSHLARKAASLHAAWSEVRHIHELDVDCVVESFRSALRASPAMPAVRVKNNRNLLMEQEPEQYDIYGASNVDDVVEPQVPSDVYRAAVLTEDSDSNSRSCTLAFDSPPGGVPSFCISTPSRSSDSQAATRGEGAAADSEAWVDGPGTGHIANQAADDAPAKHELSIRDVLSNTSDAAQPALGTGWLPMKLNFDFPEHFGCEEGLCGLCVSNCPQDCQHSRTVKQSIDTSARRARREVLFGLRSAAPEMLTVEALSYKELDSNTKPVDNIPATAETAELSPPEPRGRPRSIPPDLRVGRMGVCSMHERNRSWCDLLIADGNMAAYGAFICKDGATCSVPEVYERNRAKAKRSKDKA